MSAYQKIRKLIEGTGFHLTTSGTYDVVTNFDPCFFTPIAVSNGEDTAAMLELLREEGYKCELTTYNLYPNQWGIVIDLTSCP